MINENEKYFMMSFRFDKHKPEEFGLKKTDMDENVFINEKDGTVWQMKKLYDFGWGNECGFMRLPSLDFNDLWLLLVNSSIQENRYGAAYILIEEHPVELMGHILHLIDNQSQVNKQIKTAFKLLKLNEPINRSDVIGKSYKDIQDDFKKWEDISKRVTIILNED